MDSKIKNSKNKKNIEESIEKKESEKTKKNKKNKKSKKTLKEILSSHLENKIFINNEHVGEKKTFLKEARKKMSQASVSYKSLMEIHNILVDVYKNLLEKSENKKS